MIFNVLKVTEEHPMKNDFVLTCKKYLEKLKMSFTFEQIENMSEYQPSGEGGTRSPHAMTHLLQNPKWLPKSPNMANGVSKGVYP